MWLGRRHVGRLDGSKKVAPSKGGQRRRFARPYQWRMGRAM
jgi:hypothetical protein